MREFLWLLVVGLVTNEIFEWSSWLAMKVVRPAARMWSADQSVSDVYAEEWQAVVRDRPGKILKLVSALTFLGAGLGLASARVGARLSRRGWRVARAVARGVVASAKREQSVAPLMS